MKKSGILLAGLVGSLLFASSVYADSYGRVKVETLNVRQAPLEEAAIARTYSKNDTVKIIDQALAGWYGVETSQGDKAYVSSDYVEVFKVKGTITGNNVNSRTLPKMNATINRQFHSGDDISVYYKVGDWYYISLGAVEAYGFVHGKYIKSDMLGLAPEKDLSQVQEIKIKAPVVKAEPKGNEVVSYAKKIVGNPYRYGGTSLTKGADCSGFTQQVMKKAGVSLQRSSSAQYANNGVKVSTNNLQPGDLLFYGYNGRVSHVGLYIGNKKMVHASSSKTGIIVSDAFRTRGKPLIGAKRVL